MAGLSPAAGARPWLAATSVHSRDASMAQIVGNAAAMCTHYPHLAFIVNFFDHHPLDARALARARSGGHPAVEGVQNAGMKTFFWKRTLTPALLRARAVTLLWLVDSDISTHPSAFPLGNLAAVLEATSATLIQPSIRAHVHGTHHNFLRTRLAHMSCVATTARFVELQSPLFAADAWAAFHERVLSSVSDEDLADSDYGIDITWCAAVRDAFPRRPACLVVPGLPATHLNTHTIERFMDTSTVGKERSCAPTCKTLMRRFGRYFKNFTHDTGTCYGLSHGTPRGVTTETGRFSIGDYGEARARAASPAARLQSPPSGATAAGGSAISTNTSMENVWLGLTSLPSADRRASGLVS